MTTPPAPHAEAALFTTIRSWGVTRGRNGVVGGVVDGLGERVGLARVPARIIVVVAAFLVTGAVALAYAAAWALLPDRDGNIIIQNFGRGITNVGALLGILVLTLIGFGNLDNGWWSNGIDVGWSSADISGFGRYDSILTTLFSLFTLGFSLLVLAAAIFGIVYLVKRSRRAGNTSSPMPNAAAHAASAPDGTAPTTSPPDHASATSVADSEDLNAVADDSAVRDNTVSTPGQPQPWEPALLPGDPTHPGRAASAIPIPTSAQSTGAPATGAPANFGESPLPPAAPRPPTLRAPGPGKRFYLLTLAWLFISSAIVVGTDRIDRLAVSPGLAWFALFMVGYGLILAGVSIVGRKLGFLGFLSVPLVIAGMMTAINSGEVSEAYDSAADAIVDAGDGYWTDGSFQGEDFAPADAPSEPTMIDPTAAFAPDYQQIYIAPQCYEYGGYREAWGEPSLPDGNFDEFGDSIPGEYASQARLTYTTFTSDITVDVVAENTIVTIPERTNIILRADSNSQAFLEWESRGISCEFWEGGQDNFSVVNAGAPTLTLVVRDDAFANTIEIVETPVKPGADTAVPEPTTAPEPTASASADAADQSQEEVQS